MTSSGLASHLLNYLHCLGDSFVTVFTCLRFRDAQLCVASARPVDQHDDLVRRLVDIDNDFFDERS